MVLSQLDRLDGQVVKTSASKAEDPAFIPGFESRLRQDFFLDQVMSLPVT